MSRTRRVPLDDVQLFVHELGAADVSPPLLVVHGGPDWDHTYLLPGLELVARTRHVVAFDLRGCGRSSQGLGEGRYQPELVVQDVVGLVHALGHDRVDLLGFSTGGQVAQLVVEAHPEIVRRLVLASTTAYPVQDRSADEVEERSKDGRAAGAPWPAWAGFAPGRATTDAETTLEWAVQGAPTALHDLSRLEDYLVLLSRVRFSGEWLPAFRAGRLHPWRPADPETVLRRFPGPVLVLHGAHDLTFPAALARRLHAAVPGSDLVVLDGAGHMAHVDRPEQWADAVVSFLADAAPARS